MTVPTSLTWAEVHAARARRHLLCGTADLVPPPGSAVAGRLAGIQAQVESTAGLCLSARFPRASATQVTQSLAAPGLARLWAMRGTLHLVPTSDVHRYAAALGDSVAAAQRRLWPRYGVPADAEQAVNAALVEALDDGPLPRAALATRVGMRLGPAYTRLLSHPWGIGLKPAVARGLIATEGAGRTLTLRLPAPAVAAAVGTVDRQVAQAWLAGLYLAANVAGTAASFAAWAGLPRGQARAGLAAATDRRVRIGGFDHALCWKIEDADAGPAEVRLVPAFDPFVLAVADKAGWTTTGGAIDRIFRAGGWVSAVVLRAGAPVGVWELSKGRRRSVVLDVFDRLDRQATAQLTAESGRVEEYIAAAGT